MTKTSGKRSMLVTYVTSIVHFTKRNIKGRQIKTCEKDTFFSHPDRGSVKTIEERLSFFLVPIFATMDWPNSSV